MITTRDIDEAARRISPHILQTPLIRSNWLSEACGGEVYLKLESEQYTGSFKARGSLNKLLWLQENKIDTMPVTASTGNHGLGFARGLALLDMKGRIYLPRNAAESKVEAIRGYSAELEFHGDDPYTTERFARQKAEDEGWEYVSPYNDPQIIAGQGTVGRELTTQIETADNILVTVGGGGLVSGIGIYLREAWPEIKIMGCQPSNSPEMSVAVEAGEYREVASKATLSDGSAGGFEPDAITFDLCKKLIDDFILVDEEEIAHSIRMMLQKHSKLVEGAAAVAIASLLQQPRRYSGQTTLIVVCGANISVDKLRDILL